MKCLHRPVVTGSANTKFLPLYPISSVLLSSLSKVPASIQDPLLEQEVPMTYTNGFPERVTHEPHTPPVTHELS